MPAIFAAATLTEYFTGWGVGETAAWMLATFIHGFILVNFFAVLALVFIWLERKVSGRMQDRLGPTRVGGRFGWLQTLADGIKLIQKEDLIPPSADHVLFRMAPYIACIASFCAFMVIPFADGWVAVDSDVGIFLLFAILSLEVVGIILAGYSSGSKWALFGGMREAAQMVSYEIPMAICALVPIVAVGTLNPVEIGRVQAGWFFPNWLMFYNPFTFIAFFVFFTVATASCKRAPFDLAEAESELVAGFHTEYSGMRWSFFFHGRVFEHVRGERGGGRAVSGGLAHGDRLPRRPARDHAGDGVRRGDRSELPGKPGRLRGAGDQGLLAGLRADLDSMDAAAAADRPGDDDVFEISRAHQLLPVSRGDAVAARAVAHRGPDDRCRLAGGDRAAARRTGASRQPGTGSGTGQRHHRIADFGFRIAG